MEQGEMNQDEFASALLAASPDGVLLVDATGTIVLANPAAASIFGRPVDDLVGLSVDELVPSEQRDTHVKHRADYSANARRRPMGSGLQLFGQQADGFLFPIEISLSPVDIDGDAYTIAAVRDVTERQEVQAHVARLHERERIARDLHDMVIQRLFAAGMTLQAMVPKAQPQKVSDRIAATVGELDDTIRELRIAVFKLNDQDARRSLSSVVTDLVKDRSSTIGFPVELRIDGELDDLPDYVGEQLVATVTEGLSNVIRHARASAASVEVVRREDDVRLTIADNGCGIPQSPKRKGGLSNMMWRAAELGGTLTVGPNTPSGTRLVWSVPI